MKRALHINDACMFVMYKCILVLASMSLIQLYILGYM